MEIVKFEEVVKIIKGKTVLNNVNFSLDDGKIYGFIGPNGSGKTMLFRVMAGLVKPTSGIVTIMDKQLHKEVSFPESISVILEKPGFLDEYNAFDNLKFLANIKGRITPNDIMFSIKQVGLDPKDKRPIKAYSLGMKQKLAIAQAIMEQPRIILLDEPTSALDGKSVLKTYEIIQEEKKRGATICISSHHSIDIDTLCDKVYKINDGVIQGT